MRPRNWISLIFLFTLAANAQDNEEAFRTPAKLFAGAYSIKLMLKKGFTDYDVPVWIKPDQAESTLDASFMKDLGYVDKVMEFEETDLSNQLVEKKKFKNLMSEWAFVPDFFKSCCYGVIGQDILRDYELRFDPRPPAHVEWKHILSNEQPLKLKPTFQAELKKTFSLTHLNEVPFVLNLQEQKLVFEGTPPKQEPELFSFSFVPPARTVKVERVLSKDTSSAKKAGLTIGTIVTDIDGKTVTQLDRWQIEKYLRGEIVPKLKFRTKNNKEFLFDFTNREFVAIGEPLKK